MTRCLQEEGGVAAISASLGGVKVHDSRAFRETDVVLTTITKTSTTPVVDP
jgi:hypothetical protein